MKSSGAGERTPRSFDLLKILAKALQKEYPGKNDALKIWVKMVPNVV